MQVLETVPALEPEQLERTARMFAAVGEPGRLRILEFLLRGEQCVGDISQALGVVLPVLSQRLKVLYSHGVLTRRRAGRHIYYSLADDHVAALIHNALAHFGAGHREGSLR